MTEPDAGSAVTELTTTAVPDGDGFRVTGQKIFTTHGLHATVFLVYVRYGPGTGNIGSVLIERGQEGFTFGKPVRFLSGEEWNPLFFDNVYVPKEKVLLGPGGFKKQMPASMSSASAIPRAVWRWAVMHSIRRLSMPRRASSSAAISVNSRACSGSSLK